MTRSPPTADDSSSDSNLDAQGPLVPPLMEDHELTAPPNSDALSARRAPPERQAQPEDAARPTPERNVPAAPGQRAARPSPEDESRDSADDEPHHVAEPLLAAVREALRRRWDAVRRPFTRRRLAAAAACAGVALVVAWAYRAHRTARWHDQLDRDGVAGHHALVAGDFDVAVQRLGAAHRAATALGLDTVQSRSVDQWYAEAQIWSQLAFRIPDEFFAELSPGTLTAEPGPAGAAKRADVVARFERAFAGRALVFDGWVTCRYAASAADSENAAQGASADSAPSAAGAMRGDGPLPPAPPADAASVSDPVAAPTLELEFDWLVLVDGAAVRLVLPSTGLADDLQPGERRRLLFGAKLAGLDPPTAARPEWRMRVDPASCVLLTTTQPLVALGWPVDPETIDLLTAQQSQRQVRP